MFVTEQFEKERTAEFFTNDCYYKITSTLLTSSRYLIEGLIQCLCTMMLAF